MDGLPSRSVDGLEKLIQRAIDHFVGVGLIGADDAKKRLKLTMAVL